MQKWMRTSVGVAAVVVATTLVTGRVVSQQYDEQMQEMTDEMKMWKKLGEPGEQHRQLARYAGKWETETIHYEPGQEPDPTMGYADYKSILGGRFVMENVQGKMHGEVFEGLGIFGYDNMKQQHFFAWFDSTGTMMFTGYGKANESGEEITYWSKMGMPDGSEMKFKSVATIINDDHTTFEMFVVTPEGEQKNMHITSRRK